MLRSPGSSSLRVIVDTTGRSPDFRCYCGARSGGYATDLAPVLELVPRNEPDAVLRSGAPTSSCTAGWMKETGGCARPWLATLDTGQPLEVLQAEAARRSQRACNVRRPEVDYESRLGLDRNELGAFLVQGGLGSARAHALVSLQSLNDLRISEALGAHIGTSTSNVGTAR